MEIAMRGKAGNMGFSGVSSPLRHEATRENPGGFVANLEISVTIHPPYKAPIPCQGYLGNVPIPLQ